MNQKGRLFKLLSSFTFYLSALFLMLTLTTVNAGASTEGKEVYEKYCIGCHGEKGDGNGAAAGDLIIKPRNFTLGIFKFKSTPTGSLPSDKDLIKTITNGLKTSSMPNFKLVPEAEKEELVRYIKTFSERWKKESPQNEYPEVVIPPYVGTSDSVMKGEKLFAVRCEMCHGSKNNVPDVSFALKWSSEACEDITRPANFNHGVIKRGRKVEDVYMSITAGVEGTPMLSFGNLIGETEIWHLTSYVLNFMGKEGR